MNQPDQTRLVRAALEARRQAFAPFSRFPVGAALLTTDGQIITGANVESASYGLTCCAERVAVFKALTEGFRRFAALAVVARCPQGPMPCGACRQILAEYAPWVLIWVADSRSPRHIREFHLETLLPKPFYSYANGPARQGQTRGRDRSRPTDSQA